MSGRPGRNRLVLAASSIRCATGLSRADWLRDYIRVNMALTLMRGDGRFALLAFFLFRSFFFPVDVRWRVLDHLKKK